MLLVRVGLPLGLMLLVGLNGLPLGLMLLVSRVERPRWPLVGGCKISPVGVPVTITLPYRSAPIGGHIRSHVRPIICSIVVVTVRAVIRIPIHMSIVVTCHDVVEAADDNDSKHHPDNCGRY
jgi:hypothetical protein